MSSEKILGLCLLASLSSHVFAQDAAPLPVNVAAMAKSANLSFEYRAGLVYSNNMYNKASGDKKDPPATSLFGPMETLKTTIKGDINEHVKYQFSYNLVSAKAEYAKATWSLMEMLSLTLGSDKVKQNGWETYDVGVFKMFDSGYASNLAFDGYAPALAVNFKAAGMVSLQLVNDKKSTDTATASSRTFQKFGKEKQPAMILEWKGDLGMLSPLVQIGSYDMNHSKYFTLGVKYSDNAINGQVDFTQDMRARNNAAGKEKTDTATNIVLSGSYNLGAFEPFLKFATYDVKQADTDAKGNAFPAAGAAPSVKDNEQGISVGSWVMQQGKAFRPYVALLSQSQSVYKASTGTETETRSNMKLLIGAAGTF